MASSELERLWDSLQRVEDRLETIEKRLAGVESTLAMIYNTKPNPANGVLPDLKDRVEKIENKINRFMVMLIMAMWSIIAALLKVMFFPGS